MSDTITPADTPKGKKVATDATEPVSDRDRQPTGVIGDDGIWRPN